MYSNLLSTIPAFVCVSFLGPLSDQVFSVFACVEDNAENAGWQEALHADAVHRPHLDRRGAHAQRLLRPLAGGGNPGRGHVGHLWRGLFLGQLLTDV